MRQRAVRFGLVSTIIVFMIITNINVQSLGPSPTDIGVSNGETYSYVLDRYIGDGPIHTSIASDKNSGMDLAVTEGGEYSITVINDTVNKDLNTIEVVINNGTHSVLVDNQLKPLFHYFSFIDWDFWLANMTADPVTYFEFGSFGVDSLIVQNGISEVRVNVTLSYVFNTTVTLEIDQFFRYDKTLGLAELIGMDTRGWASVFGNDVGLTMRLKGYDINTPFAPITTTTTTTSSNTTSTGGTSTVTY